MTTKNIQAYLVGQRVDILHGIREERMFRRGGAIYLRDAKADQQPVAFLRESIPRTSQLDATPSTAVSRIIKAAGTATEKAAADVLDSAVSEATNVAKGAIKQAGESLGDLVKKTIKLTFTQEVNSPLLSFSSGANQILGLTQIAAAASVINLGVSAIGFSVMYHKLNTIQNSLRSLSELVINRLNRIDDNLSQIKETLEDVYLISLVNQDLLLANKEMLTSLRQDTVDDHATQLEAAMLHFIRTGTASALDKALLCATEKRKLFERRLQRVKLQMNDIVEAFFAGQLYRLWALSGTIEGDLLRRAGSAKDASMLLLEMENYSRGVVRALYDATLGAEEMDAFRFCHRKFNDKISLDRIKRIMTVKDFAAPPTANDVLRRTVQSVEAVTLLNPDNDWFAVQESLAALIDTSIEIHDRISSTAVLYNNLNSNLINWESWEGAEQDSELKEPTLFLIELP